MNFSSGLPDDFLFNLLEFLNFSSPHTIFFLPFFFVLCGCLFFFFFAYSSLHTALATLVFPLPHLKSPVLPATYLISAVPHLSYYPHFFCETP